MYGPHKVLLLAFWLKLHSQPYVITWLFGQDGANSLVNFFNHHLDIKT
jgi:hypothetical protein